MIRDTIYPMVWSLMVGVLTTAVQVANAEGGPLVEEFRAETVVSVWRDMANEQVVFPLDMQNIAVKISKHRQLFLDNYLIAKAHKVKRQVHPPRRYANNPVLRPPPVKLNHAVVQQVLQFKNSPRFRMWYCSWDAWQTLPSGQRIRHGTSYAISDDGVNWEKPALDLHQIEGIDERNVVIPYGMAQGVFHEPDDPDPQKRFKALVCIERKNPTVREGYYLHTSPDGIHWKGDLSRCVLPSLNRGHHIPQNGVGDTTRFWWDPIRKKYIGDVKFVVYGKQRARGIMESDDLIHWSRARPTFVARADDAQIYGHFGFAYQGMYIGTRWIFLPRYSRRHSSYVELDCSRDGFTWTRVGAGQPFMAFNARHDTWDATIMRPISLLEVGDEIWIYYFGAPSEIERDNPRYPSSAPGDWSAGLAILPRDRFVSINGGEEAGKLVTRPLGFKGEQLHVNAAVAADGELRVGLQTYDGKPVAGYSVADCNPVQGDRIDIPLTWANNSDVTAFSNTDVRIVFSLRKAKLYSFWIE